VASTVMKDGSGSRRPAWLERLPVRARIGLLGALPLIGLAALASAAWYGQSATAGAYAAQRVFVEAATATLAASGDVQAMSTAAVEFLVKRSPEQEAAFAQERAEAAGRLARLRETSAEMLGPRLASAEKGLAEAKDRFADLVKAQDRLGRSETSGLSGALAEAGTKLDDLVKDIAAAHDDTQDMLTAFIAMQRSDQAFKLRGNPADRAKFQEDGRQLTRFVERVHLSPPRRTDLLARIKAYTDAFEAWAEGLAERAASAKRMDDAARGLRGTLAEALKDVQAAKAAVDERHDAAEAMAQRLMLALLFTTALVCGGLAILISRSVTKPLVAMAACMRRLGAGDTGTVVPRAASRDEIAEMAGAIEVFRAALIERGRLEAAQGEQGAERERRAAAVDALVRRFEASAHQGLAAVQEAASRLKSVSAGLTSVSGQVAAQAGGAESSAVNAAATAAEAASAAEQLAASVREIAHQAARSTEVAGEAVARSGRTRDRMEALSTSAGRIGEVVGLIKAIADQTNLLALNATIEAARAGEAGRGFAVVASEVKSLASQTGRATEDIAAQVQAIQAASQEAASAIGDVNAIIDEMSRMAGAVAAAVEEQNAAVAAIAAGVTGTSREVRSGAEAMRVLTGTAAAARGSADEVGALSGELTQEALSLDGEVQRFLAGVRAA
jgi:methyl-accepting chemotaxis protein